MTRTHALLFAAAAFPVLLTACATAPRTAGGKLDIESDAAAVVAKARENDPSLEKFFHESSGYAVFPKILKGGTGIGGAYGKGVLYEHGRVVGFCDLSQASIGLQLGGQAYSELLFFETQDAVTTFKSGNFSLAAQASAVALKSGAGANARFTDGVAIFTMNESGLMYEASIGGQKFSYQAK